MPGRCRTPERSPPPCARPIRESAPFLLLLFANQAQDSAFGSVCKGERPQPRPPVPCPPSPVPCKVHPAPLALQKERSMAMRDLSKTVAIVGAAEPDEIGIVPGKSRLQHHPDP